MAATCARRWSAEDSEVLRRACLQVETECLQSSVDAAANAASIASERVRMTSPSSVSEVSMESGNVDDSEANCESRGYAREEQSESLETTSDGTDRDGHTDAEQHDAFVVERLDTHITEHNDFARTKRKRLDLDVAVDACGDAVSSCEVKKPKRARDDTCADDQDEFSSRTGQDDAMQARSCRESGVSEQSLEEWVLPSNQADADSTSGALARACDGGLLACSVPSSSTASTESCDDDECSTARLIRSRRSRRTLSIEYWSRTDECKERKWDHLDEIADQYGCPEDCIYATSLRSPRTAFLEPNLFPYDTPTGIEHWTLWHLRELDHAQIKQYVERWIDANAPHVKAWNYDDNPERSIDIFHVHVYFQVDEGETVLQGRCVDDLDHEIDLGVL